MNTGNFRRYGVAPFRLAVIHGGPGAPGSMAPVARELSRHGGVLEPLQTTRSVDAQVEELTDTLRAQAREPVTLLGHSWGAWLALITAARHPALVAKLILVGSGPFEVQYARNIMDTRLGRLSPEQRSEAQALMQVMQNKPEYDNNETLARFGQLMHISDSYDPLPQPPLDISLQMDIHTAVWAEAAALRQSGELLAMTADIRCPVLAIHGDYDPHPAAGVQEPLQTRLRDFRFVLLSRCGHEPWAEHHARRTFFDLLQQEMA